MVPKFCFPFDVERYRREQTPRDPGIQGSGIHTPRGSGTQGLRHSETLTTGDLYTQGPRLVDTVHVVGGWASSGTGDPWVSESLSHLQGAPQLRGSAFHLCPHGPDGHP